NVIDRNNLEQQVNARLVVNTSIEEDIVAHHFIEWRTLQILGEAAITSPMIRHGSTAMRNDESDRGKIFKDVGRDELHERRCVGIEVMRSGCMKVGIACGTDVNHGGYVKLDHLFVKRIPIVVR